MSTNQNGLNAKSNTFELRPSKAVGKDEVVNAMYNYLIRNWGDLPEANKRALGFDSLVDGALEEAALHRLTRIFMECAEISCTRALAARRRRLAGSQADCS